jgi:Membrane domain of glycerophosphoryl diester phosphodiesterase
MSEPADWATPDPGRPPEGFRPGLSGRPKPGVIPLRPLAVGEILDGAVAYVRHNPAVTLGFSAVVITITQLIELPASRLLLGRLDTAVAASPGGVPSEEDLLGAVGASLGATALSGLITFVATTVLTGLLVMVLGQAVLGRRMALGRAWAATRPRILGLLGLSLLTTLLLLLVVAVGFAPILIAAAAGATSGSTVLAAVAGLIVAGLLAVYLGVAWSMITPAYVLEGIPAMSAFRRSYDLVHKQWWRVFGILLVGGIIAAIVGVVLQLPFGFIGGLTDGSAGATAAPGLLSSVITAVGAIIAGTVTAPFSAGVSGLLYFDQRMRREAFDLELLRATESPSGAPIVRPRPDPGAREDDDNGPGRLPPP